MTRIGMIGAAIGAAALLGGGTAMGQVNFYTGTTTITNVIGDATFDSITSNGQSLANYVEDGLRIHCNDFSFIFTPCGFPSTMFYYPNGGVSEQINITRTDGRDFAILEMKVSHGFAGCSIFVWAQAYAGGVLVGEGDLDVTGGSLIGVSGTCDELRIASYGDATQRNAHNPSGLNAIALDNVTYGTRGLQLSQSGPCPGSMTFTVNGATPGGNVGYIYALGTGSVTIPSGACAGTVLGLNGSATLGAIATANTSGTAVVVRNIPGGACGNIFMQAIDGATCSTSNVIAL